MHKSKQSDPLIIFLDKIIRHFNAITVELKKLKEFKECENQTKKNLKT